MSSRKRYRPKPVERNPLFRMMPTPSPVVDALIAHFRSALLTITHGSSPNEEEWRTLADCINTIETLTFGDNPKLLRQEILPIVTVATASMTAAAKRYRKGQAMRLDGEGVEALRHCIDIYEQCALGLTAHEMLAAQRETQRRVCEATEAVSL